MKKEEHPIRSFLYRYRHLAILSYFFFYMAWFNQLEARVTTHFHVVHTIVDDWIPFCEYFIIPYLLWFFFIAWGVTYFAFRNVQEYYKLCIVLFAGMTIFLIISTVYPNGHYLRPTYFTHHNICTTLVEMIYANDTATNLFPSIHCFNSLAVCMAVFQSKEFKGKHIAKFLVALLTVSIILSTMFVKQHSFFDVSTALILGALMYHLVYVTNWSKLLGKLSFKKKLPQI